MRLAAMTSACCLNCARSFPLGVEVCWFAASALPPRNDGGDDLFGIDAAGGGVLSLVCVQVVIAARFGCSSIFNLAICF